MGHNLTGDGYTLLYIYNMHTLTKFIGITPLFPSLFSARYQYITLQGSIIVSCSPQRNDKSWGCWPKYHRNESLIPCKRSPYLMYEVLPTKPRMAVHREYGGTGFFSSLFSCTSADQLEYSAIWFGNTWWVAYFQQYAVLIIAITALMLVHDPVKGVARRTTL